MLAKTVATALVGLVVLLAGFFTYRQNPARSVSVARRPEQEMPLARPDAELVARGRALYEELACSRCHGLDGRGNPRSPLDGIGARRSPSEIRDWITAAGSVRDHLSRSAIRTKEGFADLPGDELRAVVEYLASLR